MSCEVVPTPDGGSVFLCSRGQRSTLKPPRGQVWCPLRGPKSCAWAGVATDVADHLADAHGRRYEAG